MPNLATLLTGTAERHGDRPALKLDDAEITYRALDDASVRVAGLLRERGLQPGGRVGIMLPNVPHFAIAYPREIEEVLYEHPAVSEAAVIAVPDEKMGELPKGPTGNILKREIEVPERVGR